MRGISTVIFGKLPDFGKNEVYLCRENQQPENMKKVICCLAIASLCLTGCRIFRHDEREFIMEHGSEWAWKIAVQKAVRAECERLNKVVTDYANQEIQDYQVMGMQDDVDRYNLLSAFDMEIFYSSGGADRNRNVKRYKDRYSNVMPTFFKNMMEMAERPGSLGQEDYLLDDGIICERLLGTPGKISRESDEDLKFLAQNVVVLIRNDHAKPSIASCEFDPFVDQWDAVLSNGSHLYVMVVRQDDGVKRYFYSLGHPYAAED